MFNGDWYRPVVWVLVVAAWGIGGAQASEAAYREQAAHVHGTGELNVVVDGRLLAIELHSPAINIVGFEHAARDEAEREVLLRTREQLTDIETLFAIPSQAGCALKELEFHGDQFVGIPAPGKDRHSDHEDDHRQGSSHDHGAHEPHHADVRVFYELECSRPEALTHIDVLVFEHFPGTQRLAVQVVGRTGQHALALTPGRIRVHF